MTIPTPHISATSKDQIAKTVLMPGDPLRAKFIADNFLEDVTQFTETRGMLGFTGFYKGKRVSVMGSGMGIPSAMIYYNELFDFYDVDCIIRVGTAGSMQENVKLHDIVIAQSACSESSINDNLFGNINFSVTPDFDLLVKAVEKSNELGYRTHWLVKTKTVTACRQIAAGDFLLGMSRVKGQRQAQCAGFQQSIHPRGRRREILSFAP